MKLRLPRKIKYLRKARHRRGFGIHSPFLFRLVREVIEDKRQYPAYRVFRKEKKRILHRLKENINQETLFYSGESLQKLSGRKKLFKSVELGYRYGKLLFRLINDLKPSQVTFIGPTFGLNLLYVSLPGGDIPVLTPASDAYIHPVCEDVLKNAAIHNIVLTEGEKPVLYNSEFIFINLPFLPDQTLKSIRNITTAPGGHDILIIRGIHKSAPMENVWKELINEPAARVTLDLYEIGIALFNKKLQKEHFVIRF